MPDLHEQHAVRACLLLQYDVSFQHRQRIGQHRLAVVAGLPADLRHALLGRQPGHAGDHARHLFMMSRQDVDAQASVAHQDRMGSALDVDAHQHRGRFVGDRTDGAHRHGGASCRTIGGDDVDRSRETRHGVAKILLHGRSVQKRDDIRHKASYPLRHQQGRLRRRQADVDQQVRGRTHRR